MHALTAAVPGSPQSGLSARFPTVLHMRSGPAQDAPPQPGKLYVAEISARGNRVAETVLGLFAGEAHLECCQLQLCEEDTSWDDLSAFVLRAASAPGHAALAGRLFCIIGAETLPDGLQLQLLEALLPLQRRPGRARWRLAVLCRRRAARCAFIANHFDVVVQLEPMAQAQLEALLQAKPVTVVRSEQAGLGKSTWIRERAAEIGCASTKALLIAGPISRHRLVGPLLPPVPLRLA